MDELEDFLDFLDRAEERNVRIRYIRDFANPFEFYSATQFRKRYRFTKEEVMFYILPIIESDLQKPNNRGLPVSPILQLIMALRFYATGSYQVSY